VRLADGVEALAHISEIHRDPKSKLDRIFKPGEPIRARVIKIDPTERKIGLTTKDVEPLSEAEHAQYAPAEEHPAATAPSNEPPESNTQS
jgi:small subunit ribosomal protein S1